MKKYYLLLAFIFCILVARPRIAAAATLRLSFDGTTFTTNGQAIIHLLLLPSDQKINALAGEVSVLSGNASFKEIQTGNSIISVWLELPHLTDHSITFSGIIPGGFSGIYSPFEKTTQPGTILTTSLNVTQPNKVVIGLKNVQIYAGRGELQPVIIEPNQLEIDFSKASSATAAGVFPDSTPPSNFSAEIIKLPEGPDGWYAIFSALDSGSGIDHYEIQENSTATADPNKWHVAQSPFLLQDQKRQHYIFFKAVDHSGLEAISFLPPLVVNHTPWYIIFAAVALLACLIYGVYRLKRRL